MIASGWKLENHRGRILFAISGTFSAPDVQKFLADDPFTEKINRNNMLLYFSNKNK
jgi:hypothetical protein